MRYLIARLATNFLKMKQSESAFSFLLTTDNHLGFKEDDHIRREDSYRAFEEALSIGRKNQVDFVLLGGDLFHVNRPSNNVEHRCMKIIRAHMQDDPKRGATFKRIKGEFSHISNLNHANFEDPNLTVPYPILTIHGNHDDPTGPTAQSVCKKLATCGLINYFGVVQSSAADIVVEPIILQKDDIKIALYGMGFIPDFKLKIAFEQKKVKFQKPPKDTYNILIVHQNRIPHLQAKYIPDDIYPDFIHLLIRGHEHDSNGPQPFSKSKVNGLVYQPGSTVATSISSMESGIKKVALFHIYLKDAEKGPADQFRVDYQLVELTSSRPMLVKDVFQKDISRYIKKTIGRKEITSAEYQKFSEEYVLKNIETVLKDYNKSPRRSRGSGDSPTKIFRPKLPLLRFRIEYISKSERFDEHQISARFYPEQVANKDIILFKKQKLKGPKGEEENLTFADEEDEDELDEVDYIDLGEEKRDLIDVMIEQYFKDKPEEERLKVLSLDEYTNAVRGSSSDGNVISKVLAKKKQEILGKFDRAINAGNTDLDTTKKVEEWFLKLMKNEK